MSSYVLDSRTFIEVDEVLYVLVRFKDKTVNYVCEKCDLYKQCCKSDGILIYYDFCNSYVGDDRWFFKDFLLLESDDKRKFIKDLRKFAVDLESYFLE